MATKRYLIGRREIHTTWYEVRASNNEEALEVVEDGGCADLRTDYVDALPSSFWSVVELDADQKVDNEVLRKRLRQETTQVKELKKRLKGEPKVEDVTTNIVVHEQIRQTEEAEEEEHMKAAPSIAPATTPRRKKPWAKRKSKAASFAGVINTTWIVVRDGRVSTFGVRDRLKRLGYKWIPPQDNPAGAPAWRMRVVNAELERITAATEELGVLVVRE